MNNTHQYHRKRLVCIKVLLLPFSSDKLNKKGGTSGFFINAEDPYTLVIEVSFYFSVIRCFCKSNTFLEPTSTKQWVIGFLHKEKGVFDGYELTPNTLPPSKRVRRVNLCVTPLRMTRSKRRSCSDRYNILESEAYVLYYETMCSYFG